MNKTNILTVPVQVFEQVVTTLLSGETNRGVKLKAENSIWTIGIATDEESEQEFVQIIHEPILITAV